MPITIFHVKTVVITDIIFLMFLIIYISIMTYKVKTSYGSSC